MSDSESNVKNTTDSKTIEQTIEKKDIPDVVPPVDGTKLENIDLDVDLSAEDKKQLKKIDFEVKLKPDIDKEGSKAEKKIYQFQPLSMQEQMKNYNHKEEIANLNLELSDLQRQFRELKEKVDKKEIKESDKEVTNKVSEIGKRFTEVGRLINNLAQENKIFLLKSYLGIPHEEAIRVRGKDADRIIKICERKEQRLFF